MAGLERMGEPVEDWDPGDGSLERDTVAPGRVVKPLEDAMRSNERSEAEDDAEGTWDVVGDA